MASKARRAKRASSIRANNAKGSSSAHEKRSNQFFGNSNTHAGVLLERYKKENTNGVE